MKILVAAVAVATLFVIPGCLQQLTTSGPPPAGRTAQMQPAQSGQVVSNGGQVVGQDPDAGIRLDMQRQAEVYLRGGD